jgi:hypothetical protein
MLEQFFIRPETVDRIRSSWIGGAIEQYVTWMAGRKYAPRTVCRRIPILMRFGEFSWDHGARNWAELPDFVADFVAAWQATRCHPRHSQMARDRIAKGVRILLEAHGVARARCAAAFLRPRLRSQSWHHQPAFSPFGPPAGSSRSARYCTASRS